MEILGYALALLIGLSLGLIGGGGSILALPVLVYILGVPEMEATSYSFFVVGLSAWVGTFQKISEKLIHYKSALIFGVPSIISVYFSRWYILPNIPSKVPMLGLEIEKEQLLMLFFSLIMVFAGLSTIKKRKNHHHHDEVAPNQQHHLHPKRWALLAVFGLGEGILTGMVGAGGGFLIIPILLLVGKLNTKKAMATSLFIIAVKSSLGFLGDITQFHPNWWIILPFAGISIVGIFIGDYYALKIKGKILKTIFSFFLILLGISIFVIELLS
jgi:uncharacterized membrane protein YfcA